ncbi:uncharacterized protein LOC141646861 [Silene latifolia]|uniref:uncharacterized protein LOC141646861 n=1 Tax=Silene latifolia TaxID=37657 RepID=UPI003D76F7F3
MSCTTNEKKVSMKLMVNKNTNKVIFAEAGQECVEFISQIMSLPLSTVTNILHAKGMVNPISTLFKSIKSPNYPNLESSEVDNSVLNPSPSPTPVGTVTDGVVYMIMDNLDVKPMSMSLIKPYVTRIGFLEEKIVQVGSQEALAILKASFESNEVLTNVFLGKKTGGGSSSRIYPSTTVRKALYLVLVFAFIGMIVESQGKMK